MRRIAPLALALGAALTGSPARGEPAVPPPTEPAAAAAIEEAEKPAAPSSKTTAPVVSDGPVSVTTRLSPDPSNIGDLLTLEVVAAYPRDVRVNLPTKLTFGALHHVRTEEGEAEPTGDGLRKVFRIELQCFSVGPAEIPGFPLTYVDAEGGVHTVQIPPRAFTVESLLANEDDPQRRGEDPPISREYPDTLAETVIYSVLATLLAALGLWLVARRIWGRERPVVLPPPIPAHEVAFAALGELERGELLKQGELQRYYVELTEIAKGYLEGRFGVEALDRTTEEIRQSMLRDGKRLAPLSADDVIAFLQECDLVKFARLRPPDDEARAALGTVREMVESSLPARAASAEKESDAAKGDQPAGAEGSSEAESAAEGDKVQEEGSAAEGDQSREPDDAKASLPTEGSAEGRPFESRAAEASAASSPPPSSTDRKTTEGGER